MSDKLIAAKLAQAKALIQKHDVDIWLTFVRESAEGGDPVLPLILHGGLTWQSALLVTRSGKTVAILGNYDADPLVASGDWDEVIPYVQSIKEPLIEALERHTLPGVIPKIAINYSTNDVKADGLSYGMFLLLESYLKGTRFENSLVSAEQVVMELRSVKTSEEILRMRSAIEETYRLFDLVSDSACKGTTEKDIYDLIHTEVDSLGYGYSWAEEGDPIVNSGPNSMMGHGVPSDSITLEHGHVFHIDLGIIKEGYSSDIQRCWYVAESESEPIPEDVLKAAAAVNAAIDASAAKLKPGVAGWEVDLAARESIVASGYEEYMHAVGHQVGRVAHDGGGILAPRWDRYGTTPFMPVLKDQVYTLELGVVLPGRGYLGIEEMVLVTEIGCEFLTKRQTDIWRLVL